MKIVFLSLSLLLAHQSLAQSESTKKIYADMEKSMGSVPQFMKAIPENAIEGYWEDLKLLSMNQKTSIPAMYKELIGLAVGSQMQCEPCVYWHTQMALMKGADEKQLKEAVTLAGSATRWSTILEGHQIDLQAFKNDVNKIHQNLEKRKNMQAMEVKPAGEPVINTPEAAIRDIQETLGFVPSFLQSYPKQALSGVWKEFKYSGLNSESSIEPEYKYLIGLAVASLVPSEYSAFYYTQSSLMVNSSKEKLQEAVALAGMTRAWGTILSGNDYDMNQFRGEVDQIVKFVKERQTKEVTAR